jgi:hypothetical protein
MRVYLSAMTFRLPLKHWRTLAATAAATAVLATADARGGLTRAYRIVRVNDAKAFSHAPGPFLTAPRTCVPDTPPIPDVAIPLAPELFGADFDPADWDEISVAGDGRMLAYASSVTQTGLPGVAKQIVLQGVVNGFLSKRIDLVSSSNDQPCARFDARGFRCAFRSSAAAGGPSNIQLFTVTNGAEAPEPETVAVTELADASEFASEPALAAVVRRRAAGGGINVRERNATIAFVSNADLAGHNPDNLEQLFLWEEIGPRVVQITRHSDPAAHVNRPTIAQAGAVIVFESTADLDPTSVDPLATDRVGNPDHVRQLFRWRRGRKVEQITWSDGDCFSPRFDPSGRFVLFASRGDPITGGNPERNLEIFRWIGVARPSQRLQQMTQTTSGANVFPRPTAHKDVFVFYSTSHPPKASPGQTQTPEFGDGPAECSPSVLLHVKGVVSLIQGKLDFENALRLLPGRTSGQQTPVLVGPPAVGPDATRIYFATNDYALSPLPDDPEAPTDEASLFLVYIGMATRRTPR